MERLFNGDKKIGVFLETYGPLEEKRRGETVKVLNLVIVVKTLTAEMASDIQVGDGIVKNELFSASTGEPKVGIRSVAFDVAVPRQTITLFATPDSPASSNAVTQAKVSKLRARMAKDDNAWDLVFHAQFGPVGKKELEFIHRWKGTQMFAQFEESEPLFEDEPASGDMFEGTDADEKARKPLSAAPAGEWSDDGSGSGKPADDEEVPEPRQLARGKEADHRYAKRHRDPKAATKAKQDAARKRAAAASTDAGADDADDDAQPPVH